MIVYSAMRTGSKDPEDPFDEANDDGADEGDLSYSPSYFHMILAMAACTVLGKGGGCASVGLSIYLLCLVVVVYAFDDGWR